MNKKELEKLSSKKYTSATIIGTLGLIFLPKAFLVFKLPGDLYTMLNRYNIVFTLTAVLGVTLMLMSINLLFEYANITNAANKLKEDD